MCQTISSSQPPDQVLSSHASLGTVFEDPEKEKEKEINEGKAILASALCRPRARTSRTPVGQPGKASALRFPEEEPRRDRSAVPAPGHSAAIAGPRFVTATRPSHRSSSGVSGGGQSRWRTPQPCLLCGSGVPAQVYTEPATGTPSLASAIPQRVAGQAQDFHGARSGHSSGWQTWHGRAGKGTLMPVGCVISSSRPEL